MGKLIIMSHFYGVCGAGFNTKTTHHAASSAIVPAFDMPASIFAKCNINIDKMVGAFFFTYSACRTAVHAVFIVIDFNCPTCAFRNVSAYMWVANGD